MERHDETPDRHYLRKEMLVVIDPNQTDDGTDEWTGAFWYAASAAIALTVCIGLMLAVFVLYFMGEFQ
jgi:hypothetical protein